jgi:hypothetical protein
MEAARTADPSVFALSFFEASTERSWSFAPAGPWSTYPSSVLANRRAPCAFLEAFESDSMSRDPKEGSLTDRADAEAKGSAAPSFERGSGVVASRDQLSAQGEHRGSGTGRKPTRRANVVSDQDGVKGNRLRRLR